jgi:hypothetical protein
MIVAGRHPTARRLVAEQRRLMVGRFGKEEMMRRIII